MPTPEELAAFKAREAEYFAQFVRRPRKRSIVYLVVVEGIDFPSFYAFRAKGVAERYAAKVMREAAENDDTDTNAGVWELELRTSKEMPD